jgi:lipopolysaccharide biosynthesis glycosyltransferase
MKKCIFYVLFEDDLYIKILNKSIESLLKNSKNNFDIFVFTDREINCISSNAKNVVVEFPKGHSSKWAYRYVLVSKYLSDYDVVLHLDSDVAVLGDLDPVFESEGLGLFVASENNSINNGNNKSIDEFWAGPLLNDHEKKEYSSIPSMCMGVWMIKKEDFNLLDILYKEVCFYEEKGFNGICKDQHSCVKTLLKNGNFNFGLQKYVIHSPFVNTYNEFLEYKNQGIRLIHFAGGCVPGDKHEKINTIIGWTEQ